MKGERKTGKRKKIREGGRLHQGRVFVIWEQIILMQDQGKYLIERPQVIHRGIQIRIREIHTRKDSSINVAVVGF